MWRPRSYAAPAGGGATGSSWKDASVPPRTSVSQILLLPNGIDLARGIDRWNPPKRTSTCIDRRHRAPDANLKRRLSPPKASPHP